VTDIARLAEEITAHGVTRLFGVPGSGVTLSLIDALEKRGITFHLTHFEGAGALMAATVGRLSGHAGVSLSIKGPGLANAVPGIAAAWFEAYPLVHLTEAFPPGSPASQAHKRMEQAALVAPVTKTSRLSAKDGPSFTSMAHFACAEEPGPVLFELAPSAPASAEALPLVASVREDGTRARELLRNAKRPIVIAGALASRAGLGPALAKLNMPVFSTAAAKGIVDERAANAAGVWTGVGLELTPEHVLLPQADLIIGIGLTAREALRCAPFKARDLAIEAVETPGTDAFAPAARVGLGDGSVALDHLCEKAWGLETLRSTLEKLQARMEEGFLPGAVFAAIDRHFQRRMRMVMDTGYFCTVGEHAWRAASADLCLLSGQGRYMGTGLPMALGAALHDSSLPTVLVTGDGGVAMYLAEAKLAAQHRLPLLIVLMTDNAFGSVRTRAIKEGLTQKPLTLDGKSWIPTFDSLGIPGTRTENINAVRDALAAWTPSTGPAFLEIPFEPNAYEAMVAGIR
jgi:acetolactate synthase I/II/III large subunit